MTTSTGPSPASPAHSAAPVQWTHQRFFELVSGVSPLRVISRCGPSTFEAIIRLERFEVSKGWMNAIQPEFHWHFATAGLRWVRSRDEVHKRSGRRVMYFELGEGPDEPPFLLIYLYRPKDAEFSPEQEERFAAAHAQLSEGCPISKES